MTIYKGYNTIGLTDSRRVFLPETNQVVSTAPKNDVLQSKKFRLTDERLVHRDLINALSIKQGEKVGQPEYGTTLWSYIMDPHDAATASEIEAEVRRVAAQDSRLIVNSVRVDHHEHGLLLAMEIAIRPMMTPHHLALYLNRYNGTIRQLTEGNAFSGPLPR